MRLVDFAPRFRRFGRMFRPPMLVRRMEPIAGRPRVTIRLRPTFNYGSLKPAITSGSNHARFVGDTAAIRLTTDGSITHVLHETEFTLDRPITMFVGADESLTENPDSLSSTPTLVSSPMTSPCSAMGGSCWSARWTATLRSRG